MSDLMLTAVLSMPYDMAMGDEFSRRQFWDRAQQALAEIERLQVGIELIETENADLLTRLDLESGTVGMIARECADLRRQLDECSQMLARQAAEIERLTASLKRANETAEHFERHWYLRGDEIERLTAERDELRRQLAEAQKEIHNLNWALGTEGYDQMATPEEQAEHEKAVRAHHDVLERLEEGKRAYEAMKLDAQRYRWLRIQPNDTTAPRIDVVYWPPSDESVNDGEGLRLTELDAAIDAAMGASNE